MDVTDAVFEPEVDMTRPWVNVDTTQNSLNVEAHKNISVVVASIPTEIRWQLSQHVNEMVQECTWNGKMCSTQYVDPSV